MSMVMGSEALSLSFFWHADVGVQVVEAYASVANAECQTDAAMPVELPPSELPSAAAEVPSLCHEVAFTGGIMLKVRGGVVAWLWVRLKPCWSAFNVVHSSVFAIYPFTAAFFFVFKALRGALSRTGKRVLLPSLSASCVDFKMQWRKS